MLKRVTAIVLACCLGFFNLEALVADVCDGDATAAEFAELATDAGAHLGLARVASTDDAADSKQEPVTVSPASTDQDDAGGPATPLAPTHEAHACHCGHAHASIIFASLDTSLSIATVPASRPLERVDHLASTDISTALRPPIA